jgi:uncharacterized SAM-binding protein YcdF (DUF218 family)
MCKDAQNRGGWLRRARLALGALVLLIALLGVLWVFRRPILIGAANLWIVDERPPKADAVLVLGGGLQYRAFEAARMFNAGLCRTVLVVNVGLLPAQDSGIVETETVLIRRLLLKKGVPDTAIVAVGKDSRNTWEDVRSARDWAVKAGVHNLVVPTDLFHTRRVHWICGRLFKRLNVRTYVTAIDPVDYHRDDWWKHENGVVGFQNELIKYWFYMLKH